MKTLFWRVLGSRPLIEHWAVVRAVATPVERPTYWLRVNCISAWLERGR